MILNFERNLVSSLKPGVSATKKSTNCQLCCSSFVSVTWQGIMMVSEGTNVHEERQKKALLQSRGNHGIVKVLQEKGQSALKWSSRFQRNSLCSSLLRSETTCVKQRNCTRNEILQEHQGNYVGFKVWHDCSYNLWDEASRPFGFGSIQMNTSLCLDAGERTVLCVMTYTKSSSSLASMSKFDSLLFPLRMQKDR